MCKSLDDLLSNSDIICICVHLTKETKNLIDKKKFNKMKKNVILINTSRGEVLDENELIKNLRKKKIKYACLDVLSNEHQIKLKTNKLINYSQNNSNLVITPHMAGLTYESETLAAEISLKNLNYFFKT